MNPDLKLILSWLNHARTICYQQSNSQAVAGNQAAADELAQAGSEISSALHALRGGG